MENKESFVFYRSFKESIGDLSDKDKLTMYEAISDYGLNQVEPELQGFPKALFSLIKPQLDANFTRWQNGCKGGAPKGNKNNRFSKVQPKYNQSTTEVQPNDNDNDNDNVNVNVNVIKKNSKKEILSFSVRQQSFHDSLIPYTEMYGKSMIRAFYDYWSEPTQKGIEKMRYELEKTWKVESRLRTWERRQHDGK